MGPFTTFKEFQKQPAISDVKKSKRFICVGAGFAANRLLTSRCHQQNLHRLLALFAPEIHSPVQETGFKHLRCEIYF